MTKTLGVLANNRKVAKELREMKEKLKVEGAGNEHW